MQRVIRITFFGACTYIIGTAILLGFIIPDVHFPGVIELILKSLAVLAVSSILFTIVIYFIKFMQKRSLRVYTKNPAGIISILLSAGLLLIVTAYLVLKPNDGKQVVGAAFMALVGSCCAGVVFVIIRRFLRKKR